MVLLAVGMQGSSVSGEHRRPATAGTRSFRFTAFLLLQPSRFLKHIVVATPGPSFFVGGEREKGKEEKGCINSISR
jgi:hypothetical protein